MAQIRWTNAISPPQELEGGANNAPNFNFTSQGPNGPDLMAKGHQPSTGARSLAPIRGQLLAPVEGWWHFATI